MPKAGKATMSLGTPNLGGPGLTSRIPLAYLGIRRA